MEKFDIIKKAKPLLPVLGLLVGLSACTNTAPPPERQPSQIPPRPPVGQRYLDLAKISQEQTEKIDALVSFRSV